MTEILEPRRLFAAVGPIDLSVSSTIQAPTNSSAIAGHEYALNFTVRNSSLVKSPASTLKVYFSPDGSLGPSARLVQTVTVKPVNPAAHQSVFLLAAVPADFTPGQTFRIVAVADATGAVAESDETNNTDVSSYAITVVAPPVTPVVPPLTVTSASVFSPWEFFAGPYSGFPIAPGRPARAFANATLGDADQVPVSFSLTPAAGSPVVIATGTVYRQLGTIEGEALFDFTLPDGIAPGRYNVSALVDGTKTVAAWAPIDVVAPTPGVDLAIRAGTVSALTAGQSFILPTFLSNRGASDAAPFNIAVYLSEDATLDSSDILLGTESGPTPFPSMAAEDYFVLQPTLPAGLTTGQYRAIIVLDPENVSGDAGRDNNVAITDPFEVTAAGVDLRFATTGQAVVVPTAAAPAGRLVSVTVNLANLGATPVTGPFNISIYLSTNDTFEPSSDLLLGTSVYDGGVPAQATSVPVTLRAALPDTLPDRSYRLVVRVDPAQRTADVDPSDNEAVSAPFEVSGRTQTAGVVVPASVVVGAPFPVVATVTNRSDKQVKRAYAVRTYLSDDRILSADDALVSSKTFSATIRPHARASVRLTATAPRATPAGKRYVITVIDDGSASPLAAVTATNVRAPKLSARVLTVTRAPGAGGGSLVTLRVYNTGTAPSSAPVTLALFADDQQVFSARRTLNLQANRSVALTFRLNSRPSAAGMKVRISP